ncbi:MAG: hypothetical protein ACRDJE_02100 [Dehalococcoidia bacterium]
MTNVKAGARWAMTLAGGVVAEFGQHQATLHRQLEVAQTERVLTEDADVSHIAKPIPDSHLRDIVPLAKADPDAARDSLTDAERLQDGAS